MSLQATGLISGLDINSIIEDLITAESAPRRRLENRQKIFTAQQEALRNLNSNLLILQSRATGLADRTSTLQKLVTSSDIDVVTATATTSATRQTYNFEVSQLATASRVESEAPVSKAADLSRIVRIRLTENTNPGSTTFQDRLGDQGTFTIDGVSLNANLSDATVTLRNGTVNPTQNGAQTVVHPVQRSVHGNIAADGSTVLTDLVGAGGLEISAGNFSINGQTFTINVGDRVQDLITDINGFNFVGAGVGDVDASLERDGPVIARSNTPAGTIVQLTTVLTDPVPNGGLGITDGTTLVVNGVGVTINAAGPIQTVSDLIDAFNGGVAAGANVAASLSSGRLVLASNSRAVTDDVDFTGSAAGAGEPFTQLNFTFDPNAVRMQLRSNDAVATTSTTPGTNPTPITLGAGTSDFVAEMNFAPAMLDGIASAISAITPSDDTTNTYATRYVSTYDAYDQRQLTTPKQLSITKRVTKLANVLGDETKSIVARSITFSETDSNFISTTRLEAGTQTLISVSPDLLIDGSTANPLEATTPVDKIGDTNVDPNVDNGIALGKFSINGIQFTVPALSQSQVVQLSTLNGLAQTTVLSSLGVTFPDVGGTQGTLVINGTTVTLDNTDTVQDAIDKINAGVAGVVATFERGQVKLTSANTITLGANDTSNYLSVMNFALLNNSTVVSSQVSLESTLNGLTNATALSSLGITGTFQINSDTFDTTGKTISDLITEIASNSATGVTAALSGDKLRLTGPSTISFTPGSSFVTNMNFTELPSRGLDITPGTININNVLITISSGDTVRDALDNINKNATQVQRPDGSIGFGPGIIATLTSDGRIRLTSKEDTPISVADVTSDFISKMAIAQTDGTLQDVMDQINASATGVTAVLADTVRTTETDLTGDTTLTLSDANNTRSITINGQTFEASAATGIDTVQKLIDAINKNDSVGVIAMLTRDQGLVGNRSQLQLVSQNGQDISITTENLVEVTLDDTNSENAFQLKIFNTSMTLGGEDDTNDFFEKMGLTEIVAMLHSGHLNFNGADTSLAYPKATIRSGVKGLFPSQTLSTISSEIIEGSFQVNGQTVTITDPATQTLADIVTAINNLSVAGIGAQISSRGQLEITVDNADLVTSGGLIADDTLTIGNDQADPTGPNFNADDPDDSTKFFKGLGLKAVTVTEGDFAGLRIDSTIGPATVNGNTFEVDFNTSLSDIMADVNSSDFPNIQADVDVTNDKFSIFTSAGASTRITLGDATDTSNILQALELSETSQISEIAGTRAKLVSFSDVPTAVIQTVQNGDHFFLNGTKITVIADNVSATLNDVVDSINAESGETGVTASLNDPDISGSLPESKFYLKRMTGTEIILSDGTINVEAQLRLRNSNVQVQDDSNQVNTNLRNKVESNNRLGAIDLAAQLKDVRIQNGSIPDNGTFKINSVEISYTSDDSLQDIIDRINSSSAGVTAFYNALTDKLELVSNTTGSALIKLESTAVETIRLENTSIGTGRDDATEVTDNTLVRRHKFDPTSTPQYAYMVDNSAGNGAITVYDTTNQLTPVSPPRIDSTNSGVNPMGTIQGIAVKDGETPREGTLQNGINVGNSNLDSAVMNGNTLYIADDQDDGTLQVQRVTATNDTTAPTVSPRTLTLTDDGTRQLSVNTTAATGQVNPVLPVTENLNLGVTGAGLAVAGNRATINVAGGNVEHFIRQITLNGATTNEVIVAAIELEDAANGIARSFKVLQDNVTATTFDIDVTGFTSATEFPGNLTLTRAYYGTSVLDLTAPPAGDPIGFLEGDIVSIVGAQTEFGRILVNGINGNTITITGANVTAPGVIDERRDGFLDTADFGAGSAVNLVGDPTVGTVAPANPLSLDDGRTGALTEIPFINNGTGLAPDPVITSNIVVPANQIGIFRDSTGQTIRIVDGVVNDSSALATPTTVTDPTLLQIQNFLDPVLFASGSADITGLQYADGVNDLRVLVDGTVEANFVRIEMPDVNRFATTNTITITGSAAPAGITLTVDSTSGSDLVSDDLVASDLSVVLGNAPYSITQVEDLTFVGPVQSAIVDVTGNEDRFRNGDTATFDTGDTGNIAAGGATANITMNTFSGDVNAAATINGLTYAGGGINIATATDQGGGVFDLDVGDSSRFEVGDVLTLSAGAGTITDADVGGLGSTIRINLTAGAVADGDDVTANAFAGGTEADSTHILSQTLNVGAGNGSARFQINDQAELDAAADQTVTVDGTTGSTITINTDALTAGTANALSGYGGNILRIIYQGGGIAPTDVQQTTNITLAPNQDGFFGGLAAGDAIRLFDIEGGNDTLQFDSLTGGTDLRVEGFLDVPANFDATNTFIDQINGAAVQDILNVTINNQNAVTVTLDTASDPDANQRFRVNDRILVEDLRPLDTDTPASASMTIVGINGDEVTLEDLDGFPVDVDFTNLDSITQIEDRVAVNTTANVRAGKFNLSTFQVDTDDDPNGQRINDDGNINKYNEGDNFTFRQGGVDIPLEVMVAENDPLLPASYVADDIYLVKGTDAGDTVGDLDDPDGPNEVGTIQTNGKILVNNRGVDYAVITGLAQPNQLFIVDGTHALRVVDADTSGNALTDVGVNFDLGRAAVDSPGLLGALPIAIQDGANLQRVFVADQADESNVTIYGLDVNGSDLHRITLDFTAAPNPTATFVQTISFGTQITDGAVISNSIHQSSPGDSHLYLSFATSGTINRYDLVADPNLTTATTFNFQTNGAITSVLDFNIAEKSDTEVLAFVRTTGSQVTTFDLTDDQGALLDNASANDPRRLTSSVTDTDLTVATEIVTNRSDVTGEVQTYAINGGGVENVTGSNYLDILFAADSTAGQIRRIDVGNKGINPVMLSPLAIGGGMGTAQSLSLDNADPDNNDSVLGGVAGSDGAEPTRENHFLYAADGASTDLFRVDVSDPLVDAATNTLDLSALGVLTDVFVFRDQAFVANGANVSFFADASTIVSGNAPALVNPDTLAGNVTDLFHDFDEANGINHLYVGDGSTVVKRYDMTKGGTLGNVVQIDVGALGIGAVQDVAVSHPDASTTLLYVTDNTNDKVGVFNITNPASPQLTTLTTISQSGDIFVTEDALGQPVVFSAFAQDLTKFGDTGTVNAFMSLFTLAEDEGVAGNNLEGILNETPFSRNANDIADLVPGLTFNVRGTTSANTPVLLDVEPDADSIVESVEDFVDQYNTVQTSLRDTINERRIFNPTTDDEVVQGALAGNTMLRSLLQRLQSLSVTPVVGINTGLNRLSDVGISRGAAGTVTISQIREGLEMNIDASKLRSEVLNNPEAVANIFGNFASVSPKTISLVSQETQQLLAVRSADFTLLENLVNQTLYVRDSENGGGLTPMTIRDSNSSNRTITVSGGLLNTTRYQPNSTSIRDFDLNGAISVTNIVTDPTSFRTTLTVGTDDQINRLATKLSQTIQLEDTANSGALVTMVVNEVDTLNRAVKVTSFLNSENFKSNSARVVHIDGVDGTSVDPATFTGNSDIRVTGITSDPDNVSKLNASFAAISNFSISEVISLRQGSQTTDLRITDVDTAADPNFAPVSIVDDPSTGAADPFVVAGSDPTTTLNIAKGDLRKFAGISRLTITNPSGSSQTVTINSINPNVNGTVGQIFVDTPGRAPDLTGFDTITQVFSDVLTLQGTPPSLGASEIAVEGTAEKIQGLLEGFTKISTGILDSRNAAINSQLLGVQADLQEFDQNIRERESELIREFATLETALGQIQIQSQFLTAQLTALQNTLTGFRNRRNNR